MTVKRLEIRPVTEDVNCRYYYSFYFNGRVVKKSHREYDERMKLFAPDHKLDDKEIKQVLSASFSEMPDNFHFQFRRYLSTCQLNSSLITVENMNKIYSIDITFNLTNDRHYNIWDQTLFINEMKVIISEKTVNLKIENCQFEMVDINGGLRLELIQNNSRIIIGNTIDVVLNFIKEMVKETHLYFLNFAALELKRINKQEKNKSVK